MNPSGTNGEQYVSVSLRPEAKAIRGPRAKRSPAGQLEMRDLRFASLGSMRLGSKLPNEGRRPGRTVAWLQTGVLVLGTVAARCGDAPLVLTHAGNTHELYCAAEVDMNLLRTRDITVDLDRDQDSPVTARVIRGVEPSDAFAVQSVTIEGSPCGPTRKWFLAPNVELTGKRLSAIIRQVAP
jgi:hypothetical protein